MKKYKKILIDAILFFVIIGLTLYGVFHGEDLSGLKDAIKECNILWLIPAVPLVLFFIAGESIVIWHMLDCYGIYVKERSCFLFSAVGFFFSCVTPSATGGQPMQIYFMKKEDIPVPIATVILLVVTITYKFVLVVVGIGLWLFAGGIFSRVCGRSEMGLLSGHFVECRLCDTYVRSRISSVICQKDINTRSKASGTDTHFKT